MSELPYLKNKNRNQGGGGPIERDADATHPGKMLDMVADELMDAFHRKDHKGFMDALRAFHHTLKDEN